MPIRRLFGLLVCALSLSSAPVLAQTVSFIDGSGADASVYLEKTEARVRVTVSDPSPSNVDTVQVTLSAALSGDSEVVSLRETYRDSGVFEGRIRLDNNASPSQPGTLEAGALVGPPAVHDTLTAQYGSETDTASLAPASVQFLDRHGRPATDYTDGDWVHVRVEDHVRDDNPGQRDTVTVQVQNQDMGDSEILTLTETALRTGVFEGRIRHLNIYPPASDGIVSGYIGQHVRADYYVSGYAEYESVSVPLISAHVEILDRDGKPTSLVPESSPLRLRVTHRAASGNPGTVDVLVQAQLTGDQETVLLVETGPGTGVFERTLPMSAFGQVQAADGVLHTAEDVGPPHRFDQVSVTYQDDYGYSGIVGVSAATYGSETRFTDAEGKDAETYAAGFPAWVRVEDHNANQPAVVDTVLATVESITEGDSETLTLTETGQDTAIFSGSMPVELASGTSYQDGVVQAQADDTLRVLHGDAVGLTASGDLARLRGSRLQFIDADGRPVAEVIENGRARVRLEQSDCNTSPWWTDSCQVTFTSRIHADEEEIWIQETGNDTGVFVGEIWIPFSFTAGTYNGVLELGNSGSPEYLADEVTATAGSNSARVPAVAFTLRFIRANGEDAETFSPGEAVWLRLEDQGINDPYSQQTENVLVRVFGSSEIEPMQLNETGPGTGVFVGSLPSRFSASPTYDGTLDVETGSRLLVDWTHLYDSREARDEAVVVGAGTPPPPVDSPVTFRDAYGNSADSYVVGGTVYVRVVDAEANSLPTHYDFVQVTLNAPATGDTETIYLRETTRDSGIFEGSTVLDADGPYWNSGLYCLPGDEIEVVYGNSPDQVSDQATIRYSSALFIDEAGKPTGEVLENGVARLRVVGSSAGSTVNVTVSSSRGADQESVMLTETIPGSKVYEGTVQLSFTSTSGGQSGNGELNTTNSGPPDYLSDELTVTYQDGVGHAVTVPSRVRFFDSFGRATSTFAVGERVGVRVEDNHLDDPYIKEQMQVLVHEVGSGDADTVTLIETGFDTNTYEGSIATEDAPVTGGDGKLQLTPGQVIQAERLNQHTPHPTTAQATMAGASVVFVDAEGRPVEAYFERTRAYVRVSDAFADINPSADQIMVTVQTFLGLDSESLSLIETGPSTGVFEGSIQLATGGGGSGHQNNGLLETSQYAGPPLEYDTLTASYQSVAGPVSGTAGILGSRTWFIDAYGNETDSYVAGTMAYMRVEDHAAAAMPGSYDFVQVTLTSPMTGDTETAYLRETTRDSGIFEGAYSLDREPGPSYSDGRLQSMPGEEIEVVYEEQAGDGRSSDTAAIRYSSAEFIDENGEPTGEVLENGVARMRVVSASPGSSVNVDIISRIAQDEVSIALTETFPGSKVYEGTVQLSFVPQGGGMGNGLLETSTSGSPDYLGDDLTLTYQDGVGRAVTIPSRVRFIDGYGRVTSTFAVGERVGVRVEDHNLDDPYIKEQMQVLVHEVGSGDGDSVTLIETGFDTNVYEGSIATEHRPATSGDGKLQVMPGRVIQAERLNQHTPYPTAAQATMAGAAVLFIDAEGQPAEAYFERTRAYVRVSDSFANFSPSADQIMVTVQSFLGQDSESVSLTETGPSTGVFEGSIALSWGGGNQNNGFLETGQYNGPPYEYDTLTATHQSVSGTVSDTVGMIGSRIWFLDAYGNETDSYTAGTTAYVRVEDHVAGSMPSYYDYAQVTLTAPMTGDSETLYLRETTRESGIFEGSIRLDREPGPGYSDGRLQSTPGEEIEVEYEEQIGDGRVSDTALIRYSSAEFIDEAGEPTNEVLENGVARLRVITASPGPVNVSVTSSRAQDQVTVTLTETAPGSKVYEGTVQLSFVPPGGGMGNGLLETSTSGSPDYLGDDLTITYQDGVGHAVTIPSRVRFIDGYGRVTSTFAVGESVGVRVEDHNLDDPYIKEQMQVLVHEVGSGDADSVTLIETGFDTNIYEGSIATEDRPATSGDGKLQVRPGRVIQAERLNLHTPYPTVAQATMAGAAVLFVDAEGRPAEAYFEKTRAFVRVSDSFANFSPSADQIMVTVQSFLGQDSESVSLTETGPTTGVFEGSIALSWGGSTPNNGFLETAQDNGPPHEYDVLTASYSSAFGPASDTAGILGSRTWFLDAYGNETDSYTAGTTAYIRVEDHIAGAMPGNYDYTQVTLTAPMTGDSESLYLMETTRDSGIFEGSIRLDREPGPGYSDGRLQSMPGEEIEVLYDEPAGQGRSSDEATILYSSAEFIDEAGEPTNEVLENGVARLRVTSASPGSSVDVSVTSSRAQDQVSVTLHETVPGSKVYEGTVQLSFVPQGGGMSNGLLETSTSGSPDYLGDDLTLTYQDGVGHAVTIPSRVRFIDGYGRVTSTFAVGESVGVRVEDHNLDDPYIKEQMQVLVRAAEQGSDASEVTLIETGFDTNIYEGSIATEYTPPVSGDGKLQLTPGQVIEAERLNLHTPYPTVARATMSGASVVFVDAEGQPAELYYEGTRAYVRVADTFANYSPSADQITVTLQTFFGLDSEALSLTETGPSTGVFEGSIQLSLNTATANNGILETAQHSGPPSEFDTLTASYQSVSGPVSDTAGIRGSRTWFIDAYGNETDSYTAGTTAYMRVEDHITGAMPSHYDYAQVTLYSPMTGDSESVYLVETTRTSGIFEGSLRLDSVPSASQGDGRLQSMPGEEIEVLYDEPAGLGRSSDEALIRYSSAEFIDEAGEPTGEVLENGVARLRVTTASPGPVDVSVTSSRAQDQVSVTLAETAPGSKVYEGTVQLAFVPQGGGMGNGLLETSTSGSPDYLGDDLTITYQDGVGHAVTIPSRVRFIDSYGQVTSTFAVGESVGVRVEDHNLDDPYIKEQMQVLVRGAEQGSDANSVTLIETGFDTNIYEGSIATEYTPPVSGDGKLQLTPGQVIEAERLNLHTPYPTVARATMSGASVVFVDAEGQPAELYYEGTRAYVRVSDTFANYSPSADQITVTVQTFFGLDSEALSLTETGPSTGVFEGSIQLSLNAATANNGILETAQHTGPPSEFDTLTASYQSVSGPVSDTAGILGSRTWFIDAYGNEADSYTAGTTAYLRVEDHSAGSSPNYYDYAQVTLYSPMTGDGETVYLMETTRTSGIFEGSVRLGTGTASYGDGSLQSMPGEEIEALYDEPAGYGRSSDKALIRSSSAEFIDENGEPTNEVLENGVARLRVSSAVPGSSGSSVDVSVTSSRAQDQVSVTLNETFPGSKVYEGTVQLSFVPQGGGMGNGLLETSTSGSPDYLGDNLTLTYQDGVGHAVTIPSRVRFIDSYGQVTSTFAVGDLVGVRVEDHNLDDPYIKEQMQVLVRAAEQGSDANSVTLIETGFDTNIYEGSIATEYTPPVSGDGKLQLTPGQVIEAERLNLHTPYPTVARATMAGASVVFIDAQGEPAESYFQSTPAYVRVSDVFSDFSPVADQIIVNVQSSLGSDFESLPLTETGPSTGVFEGSIPTSPGSASSGNGVLETGWVSIPPEHDTLTATYQSVSGPVSDTVGMIGSRTWFADLQGNPTDGYAAGSTAYIRVEDHSVSGITTEVRLYSMSTGDMETRIANGDSGFFNTYIELERSSNPVPGDGKLQSMPGEEIEVRHTEPYGQIDSTARAEIREAEAIILEDGQAVYGQVLENGVARIRIVTTSPSPQGAVVVRSLYGVDEETVSVSHTIDDFYEGTIQLSVVPPGGGIPGNGTLETSNSGSPEYLQDELIVTFLDAEGHAVTVPSRITFHAYAENWPVTEYPVGSDIRVRVQDRNANDPSQVDTTWVLVTAPGDSEGIALTETGADTGIFEGTLPSSGNPGGLQDGTLSAGPGTVATAEHLNVYTPNPTTAQVTFNGNFAPLAVDDAAETEEEQPVTIDVLANDSDPDQEPLTVGWPTQGAHGSVAVVTEGIVYTPEAGFVGTDSFTYVASDPRGGESRATVTVTVIQGNEPPVALVDLASTQEDEAVNIDVLANDSDPDDDPLTVVAISTPPMSGTATIEPDNTITYTPNPDFNGTDGFYYEIEDPDGETAIGAVTVFIAAVNDAPVANDDAATVAEDSYVTVTVLTNDTDVENNTLDVTAVTQGAHGAVVLNANDTVTYTPNANFSGADSFTYTVSDGTGGGGGTDTATVNVTVTPANDAPVAVDDSATTDEDTAVTVTVLANDTDLDNDTLDVVYTTGVTNGSAVVNANETITFTPTEGFHGTVTFDYSVTDGNGGSDLGTVTITVDPVNDAPVANNDTAITDEDSSVTVNVLDNDTDPENDALEVTAVTQGANGTVTLDPVTYTPAANFHGSDSFTYTVSDGNGGTDTATVNVTINEANDAPVANDDTATVAEDSSVVVNVLGNDSDADNDTLNVTAVTQGTNGSVTLNPVTYTPNASFFGTDSFTYTVSDGNGGTDTATVTVTVTPVNDAPAANDDTASVVEDDSVTVNVLGNDTDADNDTLTVTAVTQGANGTVTLNPVTYTPSPNFFGTDSFTYTISDGNGGSDTATVTVTIAASNDNLTAVDDSATVAEDGSVTVAVLGNDSDPENDVLSVQSVTQGTNGSVAIVGTQVTYTPNPNFHGSDSFTYTASDGNGGTDSATVTITVTPVNDAPVAGDDTASVVEDGSVSITVLGNDADVDEDLLTVTSVTQGAHGTVVINGDDTVTYTPAANYNGSDSFTYTVSDGEIDDTATVTVTIGAANDAPVATDDSASTTEDNPVTVYVLVNDTDPENDTLAVTAVTQGANGAVQHTRSGTVIYTPAANFHGTDSFTYTANDDNGGTDIATVTITVSPVNDAPVANDDPASVAEDGSVTVAVLANDTDADNDTLTVTAVTQGAHGTVTMNPVTYTPAANYHGADSFTYTISDGNGGTDTATVNVTVGSTNDAPNANDDTATTAEDNAVTVSVLTNDTDLDNDTLTVISVTQPANGTVTMNPVKYTPNANFFGTNSFTYTVSDGTGGGGGTDTATVTVTVTAVNDAPVAVNDTATTLAETAVVVPVRTNDTDVEGNTLTITSVTQGAHGTVAINAGQTVTYTPATAWIGPDTFTYTISDGNGGTATATVNVTVQAPPRVTANIQVLYPFNEGSGTTVNDTSGVGAPLNLTVANAGAVTWLPGALSINSNTLIQTAGTATKVINASKASNEVTVEAWVDPLNLSQTGPAAIVTISQTHTKRDVTLGQSGTAYNGQLRTSTTGQDGTLHSANNVVTANLTHVVYTRSSTGAVRIYVNGTQVATGTLTGNLSGWANYNLALGGELSGTRYWRGEMHLVAIYSRALTATEVRQNFLAGAN